MTQQQQHLSSKVPTENDKATIMGFFKYWFLLNNVNVIIEKLCVQFLSWCLKDKKWTHTETKDSFHPPTTMILLWSQIKGITKISPTLWRILLYIDYRSFYVLFNPYKTHFVFLWLCIRRKRFLLYDLFSHKKWLENFEKSIFPFWSIWSKKYLCCFQLPLNLFQQQF